MNQLSSNLSDVDKQVEFLCEQLSASVKQVTEFVNVFVYEEITLSTSNKASEIEISLNAARQAINASQELISELADEYNRWQFQVFIDILKSNCFTSLYLLLSPLFVLDSLSN